VTRRQFVVNLKVAKEHGATVPDGAPGDADVILVEDRDYANASALEFKRVRSLN
jgi:hypothetical protein